MQRSEDFKRLPARRWGALRRASLWDAGEYLLSVSGTSFSEHYRRFYYRDIQSIVVQKGPRLGSIGGLLIPWFITTIFGLIAAGPGSPPVFHWLWLAPLAWSIWVIYANLARGCRVFVYTAVSSEELPAIYRRGVADRVLPRILSKILLAQGSFEEAYSAAASRQFAIEGGAQALQSEAVAIPRLTLYSALGFFLLILGSAVFAYWYSDAPLTPNSLRAAKVIAYFLNAAQVISGVVAVSKLFRIRLLTFVRALILSGLGMVALRSYAFLLVQFQLQIQKGSLLETMVTVHFRHWMGTCDCALSLLVAIMGLISLTMSWQDDRRGSTSSL